VKPTDIRAWTSLGFTHPAPESIGSMKRPRVSIAGLMLGIAVAAFPIAVLASVLGGRAMLGLGGVLEMGLQVSVTALGIGVARIVLRRGRCGPFAVGFQAAGWTAVIAYVAGCLLFPEFMSTPYIFYVNEIEPSIMDADYWEVYALSLVLRGLIWGIPLVLVALGGGGLAALVAPRTIVIGGRSAADSDSAPATCEASGA
jgi:hypothetical protein